MERQQRKLAAILAADVAGYSRLMEGDEVGTLARLKLLRSDHIEPAIRNYGGRLVGEAGDSLLVEFPSASDAVTCAMEVQVKLASLNGSLPESRRMAFRMGINLGEVIVDGTTIHGDGVNVAARLEKIAEPGSVVVAQSIYVQVKGKLPFRFEDLGETTLHNIAEPVRLHRVVTAGYDMGPGALALPAKPSIVVLPFTNMSDDPEQAHFSDGITEDIITDLSKLSGLFVIARNSAFTYKGTAVRVQDVCRALGVRHVVEGSVRRSGNRVRITAQLVDGTTGGHVWAERYDRDLTDVFAVQDEITGKIVAALAVRLSPDEARRLERRPTENLEAYDFYVRGSKLTIRLTRTANDEARTLLAKAVALDPGFAQALALLSFTYALRHINGWTDPREAALDTAHDLATSAVALDPEDSQSRWNLGIVLLWRREHDRAIAEYRMAVDLDPNLASAHAGLGNALHYAGQSRDAINPILTAMRLDPYYSDVWMHFLALAYFGTGQYENAIATLQRRIIHRPDTDISRVLLASCYGYLDRGDEARIAWQEALRANPAYSLEQKRRVLPYKDPAEFEKIVDGLRRAGVSVA